MVTVDLLERIAPVEFDLSFVDSKREKRSSVNPAERGVQKAAPSSSGQSKGKAMVIPGEVLDFGAP